MDFTKILNIANDNKNRAIEQEKRRKDIMKSRMKANNVTNDAVKRFLERKELEKRRQEAQQAKKRDELLSLRTAAKNNRKASAMAKRTKDNNFGKFEDNVGERESAAPNTGSRLKTQENLRPVVKKDAPIRTNSVNGRPNGNISFSNQRPMKTQENSKSRIEKDSSVNNNRNSIRPADKRVEKVQGKINFPAKKPAKAMDFNSLMKLAKTKQHEPINVPEKKKVEDGRLMTQAEKRRFLEEQARKLGISVIIPGEEDRNSKQNKPEPSKKQTVTPKPRPEMQKTSKVQERTPPANIQSRNPPSMSRNSSTVTSKVPSTSQRTSANAKQTLPPPKPRPVTEKPLERKQFPPRDLIPVNKPRLANTQAVTHSTTSSMDRNRQMRRGPPPYRPQYVRAVHRYDDEEEEEEMSDFIDDGPMGENEDYSKHIREIFGYDKRKYAMLDDDDCIESSFSRQMQEESYSARVGLLEDLEDIKREQEELERQYKSHKKRKL